MNRQLYVLEVLKYNTQTENLLTNEGKLIHIGYMNLLFNSKYDACSYYDKFNPHMRKMNSIGTYTSDWDPVDKLLYIVREYFNQTTNIVSFEKR